MRRRSKHYPVDGTQFDFSLGNRLLEGVLIRVVAEFGEARKS